MLAPFSIPKFGEPNFWGSSMSVICPCRLRHPTAFAVTKFCLSSLGLLASPRFWRTSFVWFNLCKILHKFQVCPWPGGRSPGSGLRLWRRCRGIFLMVQNLAPFPQMVHPAARPVILRWLLLAHTFHWELGRCRGIHLLELPQFFAYADYFPAAPPDYIQSLQPWLVLYWC